MKTVAAIEITVSHTVNGRNTGQRSHLAEFYNVYFENMCKIKLSALIQM